ncbi:MAG: hypothetical protein RLZZ38_1525 [Bacteroidota bacterium]|jgi:hypothetical protein
MASPVKRQNFQDWLTQKWVILFGRKVAVSSEDWLLGPFGEVNGIGKQFINQLVQKENLYVDESQDVKGLLRSIDQLNLQATELNRLAEQVKDFYENTSRYELQLSVDWNPFFKPFGFLLRLIFSRRIKQLNIPLRAKDSSAQLKSAVIHLKDPQTHLVKRTVWFRSNQVTDEVIYAGVYETCHLPSAKTCIKAIFPLPNGSATVILKPSVGQSGELILDSSGKQFGDSGFYFLLQDSNGQFWAKFIRSFRDKLVVEDINGQVTATQTLSLWHIRVLTFVYLLKK